MQKSRQILDFECNNLPGKSAKTKFHVVKGIILAGGTGSRLWPLTLHISKQLLPVYDKPLIYYPISTLMLAGIREILIITRPEETELFRRLLGNGEDWGISIAYEQQERPRGIAEAFIIGENFLNGEEVCLILGDNIFFGMGLGKHLREIRNLEGAHIFGYRVSNPQDYGVLCIGDDGQPLEIIEKPKSFISDLAIPGLYFYPNEVCSVARNIKPSIRGELEISDLNKHFLDKKKLVYTRLSRGTVWLDTGSFENMQLAAQFVSIIRHRQGLSVGCPEEIGYENNWITWEKYEELVKRFSASGYLSQTFLD